MTDLAIYVVGEDPKRHPDLIRRQSSTWCLQHRLGEVLHKLPQFLSKVSTGAAGLRNTGSPNRRMG